jgi:hypothetical protein
MAHGDNGVISNSELKKGELLNKIKFNNLSSEQINTLLKLTNKYINKIKADKKKSTDNKRGFSYYG